jgi:hypothetical protein
MLCLRKMLWISEAIYVLLKKTSEKIIKTHTTIQISGNIILKDIRISETENLHMLRIFEKNYPTE